ncbi:MAG: transglutaminase domain-containing protein [Planctomycetia bacterium]|nr:transglutaminase domain-containing protein [Planctomycetia bacterium]
MDRRKFLARAGGLALGGTLLGGAVSIPAIRKWRGGNSDPSMSVADPSAGPSSGASSSAVRWSAQRPPAASIVPVVGDGKWIWTEPPKEGRGYLEPREFKVRIGIEMQGAGEAQRLKAATTAPIECPEQKIEDVRVESAGCEASVRELESGSVQLVMSAPALARGQTILATATFWLKLYKQYQGFEPDLFAYEQKLAGEIKKSFLQNSPGIQTREKPVLELAEKLAAGASHPWDKAQAFANWVPENVRARIGAYTSVTAALRDGVGDCEERSAVFVALCRAIGIPARLVWVPNHNWAEFYLVDRDGKGHWIPAHTSCYSWFGWTGAHELVLQKGDRLEVPERAKKQFRLFEDWAQWVGAKPRIRWLAEMAPLADEGEDAGPGARSKDAKGEWLLVGEHPMNKIMRR